MGRAARVSGFSYCTSCASKAGKGRYVKRMGRVKKRNRKGILDDMNRGGTKKDRSCLRNRYYGINIGYELRLKKKMERRKEKIYVRTTFVILQCVFFAVKASFE